MSVCESKFLTEMMDVSIDCSIGIDLRMRVKMESAIPIEVTRGAREVRGEYVERRAHQSAETHEAHV